MGGFGSGRRPGGGRPLVEDCPAIDVNQLHRERRLSTDWSGVLTWSRGGEEVGSAGLRVDGAALRLSYDIVAQDGGRSTVRRTVPIDWVPCGFGGARPYLRCPGIACRPACHRRVARLHLLGGAFACRRCHGLAHASQREDGIDRQFRRAAGLRARLGGDPVEVGPTPARPKRMRHATWQRISGEIRNLELTAEAARDAQIDRLLAIIDGEEEGFWT